MSNPYQPLYQTIYDDISNRIDQKKLLPGDRLPTEFEMVDHYQVSRITVTRALQELVKAGYVVRYRSKGSFVAERHVRRAPATADGSHSQSLAFIMPFSSGDVPQMLFAMQHAAQKQGFILSLFNSERSLEKERAILERLGQLPMAGVICYPIESYDNIACYSALVEKGIPLVAIDKNVPYPGVPCVQADNFRSAYRLTEHLIRQGHHRIAFYCHTLRVRNESQRFQGYLKALTDNGIAPDSRCFYEIEKGADAEVMMPENSPELHDKIGNQLKQMLSLERRPTALFCAFDLIAAYVEQQANRLGIAIPEDLSVAGFDNLPLCDHLQVPLTSMAQDFKAIGNKAVELIGLQLAGQPVEPLYQFDGAVIPRRSVKKLI